MPVLSTLSAFTTGTADGAGSDSTSRQVQAETGALANGVPYLVLFEGGAAPDGATGTVVECDLQFGSTEYALSRGTFPAFDPPDGGVRAARLAGACLITGNGTDTVSIGTRRFNGSAGDETLWSGGGVKCIPLNSLTEDTHYWQHQGENNTTADTTPTGGGGWTQVGGSVTFTAPTTGQYLVIMSAESQHQSDATTTDAVRIRFRQTTDPAGTPVTITLGAGDNSGELSPAIQLFAPGSSPETVIGHTRYQQVVSLTQGETYEFFIEADSPGGGGNTEYRRERIFVFDADAWAGGFQTADETVGQQLASPGPATFGPLNIADPSPDTHEYTFLAATTFQNNNTWHRSRFDLNGTDFPAFGGWGAGGFANGTGSAVDFHFLSGLAEADVSAAFALNFEVTHDTSDCPVGFAINHAGSGDPTEPSIRTSLIAWRMETTVAASTIAGTSSGTSSASAAVRGVGAVAGTAAGSATVSAALRGTGAISGTAAGTVAPTAAVRGLGAIAATAAGIAAVTAAVYGLGAILGTAAGSSTAAAAVYDSEWSDEFEGAALGDKWTIEESSPASLGTDEVTGGAYILRVLAGAAGGSFWYNDNDGVLVYQDLTGDFDVVADVEAQDAAGTSTPPVSGYRITGIAAHDPDRTAYNYVHVGVGSTDDVDLRVEAKNTIEDSSGVLGDDYPGFISMSNPSGRAEVRLRRIGQRFICSFRATPGSGAWTDVMDIDRTADPMPSTLRVGMMCYSDQASHDIQGVFRYIRLQNSAVISGTAAGVATVSADVRGLGAIAATAAGVASASGALRGLGSVAGVASGAATVSGAVAGLGAISGTSSGTGDASADVHGIGAVSGTAAGVATCSADIYNDDSIRGTAAGVATVSADVRGLGAIAGTAMGTSTATASINGGPADALFPASDPTSATFTNTENTAQFEVIETTAEFG